MDDTGKSLITLPSSNGTNIFFFAHVSPDVNGSLIASAGDKFHSSCTTVYFCYRIIGSVCYTLSERAGNIGVVLVNKTLCPLILFCDINIYKLTRFRIHLFPENFVYTGDNDTVRIVFDIKKGIMIFAAGVCLN